MIINILICDDNDTPLINETVHSIAVAKTMLDKFEYEYSARQDEITGGEHE